MEFGLEVIEAEIGPEREPLVFDFAPEDFDEVEFGAVGRRPVQADALSEPVVDPSLKRAAGVDGGVVGDDQAERLGLGGLGGEGVQHGDVGRRGDRAGHGLKVALICGADQSQDGQTATGCTGEGEGSATRSPGIRHDRGEVETALVEIKQFDF